MPDGFEDDQMYAHGEVFNHNVKSLKKSRKVFNDLKEYAKKAGYDRIYSYTQNLKWVKVLDKSCSVITDIEVEGERYEVVEWVLER